MERYGYTAKRFPMDLKTMSSTGPGRTLRDARAASTSMARTEHLVPQLFETHVKRALELERPG